MWKKNGSILNIKDYLLSVIIVVSLSIKIVNVIQFEKTAFPKRRMISYMAHGSVLWPQKLDGGTNVSQPKSSENDNEETQVSEGEEVDGEPSLSRHQQLTQPLTGSFSTKTTCQ